MADLSILLPIGAVVIFALIIYAIFHVTTCILRPGFAKGLCATNEEDPGYRRNRLLSIYEIYNSSVAKNEAIVTSKVPQANSISNPGIIARPGSKRGSFSRTLTSIPSTIMEKNEDSDQPPTYDQAVTAVPVLKSDSSSPETVVMDPSNIV